MAIALSASVLASQTQRSVPNVQLQRFRRTTAAEPGCIWAARVLPTEAAGSSANLQDDEPVIILHHDTGAPIGDLPRTVDTSDASVVEAFLNAWIALGGTFSITNGAAAKAFDATARARAASRETANAAKVADAGGTLPRNSLASVANRVFRGGRPAAPAPATAVESDDAF